MKKKLVSILLCLCMALTLLPTSAFAATTLKHVDITIELPKGGDYFDWNAAPTIKSFKSGSIDLLANGAGFLTTQWVGDYDLDDNGNPYFRKGGSYALTLKLMLGSGYCAASTKSATTGETVVSPDNFSVTVNGVAATVQRNSSSYYPTVTVNLKLEGEVLSAAEKAEKNAEWEALTQTRRAMLTPRTKAEAETYYRDNMPEKVVTVTAPEGKDLMANRENMTTVVFNVSTANKMAADVANLPYLKEIWLSPEVDPGEFISALAKSQYSEIGGDYYYVGSAAIPLYLAEGTVFIPESRVSEFKQHAEQAYYYVGAFTVKCYSGSDVYAAQKAGASAAKELCTKHNYTRQICAADRVYHFADCDDGDLYYYSCAYCGKCENNPNHVDYSVKLRNDPAFPSLMLNLKCNLNHSDNAELPADSVYIGVNAAGNHVWYLSCDHCGVYDHYDMNIYDYQATGNALSYEDYKAAWKTAMKQQEAQALSSTERYPGTFTLPLKSDAKISAWAQADVNLALNDDLLDTALLGNDYTGSISRLQFCSIAVRLAETLTGKEITPVASGKFTDTDSAYARKAYAAGITTGVTDTTFNPNGTLTRQQMATFIYRALQYVAAHSDLKYTDYESKLSNYTDARLLHSWAVEPMAFMNALDLVKGTTNTTINPNGTCTIQQAIVVAERSVYAHLIGWYQVKRATNVSPTSSIGYAKMNGYQLREGSYVWVTGRRFGVTNTYSNKSDNLPYVDVPAINPFNGQATYMKNGDLVPVRG